MSSCNGPFPAQKTHQNAQNVFKNHFQRENTKMIGHKPWLYQQSSVPFHRTLRSWEIAHLDQGIPPKISLHILGGHSYEKKRLYSKFFAHVSARNNIFLLLFFIPAIISFCSLQTNKDKKRNRSFDLFLGSLTYRRHLIKWK